jgi:hypothetical protein
MRYSQAEKMDIIRLVEASDLPVKRTLEELEVPRSSFYRWYERYQSVGYEGLADYKPGPRQFWNPDSGQRAPTSGGGRFGTARPVGAISLVSDRHQGYFIRKPASTAF